MQTGLTNEGSSPDGKNSSMNALKQFQLSGNLRSKEDPKFGDKMVLQCEEIIKSSYITNRNIRFDLNRAMVAGRMDLNKFKDFFNIDGKTNYVNISWKSIMIVNTIVSRMVGRWMQKKEKAIATAVDPISIKKKKDIIDEAEFLLYNQDVMLELQQQSGVQVIPSDAFIADDKDDLDLWAKEELRIPEEILYEKGINGIMDECSWGDNGVNREKVRIDSASVGLVGCETITDISGKVYVKYCKPENMFYSYSEYPDFRDAGVMGEVISYKLSEIREKFPKIEAKELWEIAKTAKQYQVGSKITYQTIANLNSNGQMPIDDWSVDVVRATLKTLDVDKSLFKKGKDGKTYIDKPKKRIEDVYEGNEYVEKKIWNIYRLIYVRNCNIVLEWGLEKNMIRPQAYNKIAEAYHPYSFFMYHNVNMRNLAIPEKVEEPVEMMILTRLKIQQLIAKLKPSGNQYDIDGLQAMDLGNGIVKPLELQKITDQTGNVYYRSRDAEGNRIENPIRELPNAGSVQQLQMLIETYNHHFQVLRDEIGSNEFAEGQTIKPRVGQENVQTALEVSFNATDYMNDACIHMTNGAARNIACLLHDSVEFGSEEYRDILRESDVKDREYSTKIEMLPTTDDITRLENMINIAMQTQPDLVLYMNPEKLKRVAKENTKLAEQYFRQAQKRAIKGRDAQKEADSRMNAENQIASSQAAAQSEAQLEQMKSQSKMTQDKNKFVYDCLLAQMTPGTVVPPAAQAIVDLYLQELAEAKQAEEQAKMQEQGESQEQGEEQQAMA